MLRLCISDFTVRDRVSLLLFKNGVENRMRLAVVSGDLSAGDCMCMIPYSFRVVAAVR